MDQMVFSDPVVMVNSLVSAIRNKYSEKEKHAIEKSIDADFSNAKKQKSYKNAKEMFSDIL